MDGFCINPDERGYQQPETSPVITASRGLQAYNPTLLFDTHVCGIDSGRICTYCVDRKNLSLAWNCLACIRTGPKLWILTLSGHFARTTHNRNIFRMAWCR